MPTFDKQSFAFLSLGLHVVIALPQFHSGVRERSRLLESKNSFSRDSDFDLSGVTCFDDILNSGSVGLSYSYKYKGEPQQILQFGPFYCPMIKICL